jgi:hypothetical protein
MGWTTCDNSPMVKFIVKLILRAAASSTAYRNFEESRRAICYVQAAAHRSGSLCMQPAPSTPVREKLYMRAPSGIRSAGGDTHSSCRRNESTGRSRPRDPGRESTRGEKGQREDRPRASCTKRAWQTTCAIFWRTLGGTRSGCTGRIR